MDEIQLNAFELQARPSLEASDIDDIHPNPSETAISALKPVDGGRDAWTMLIAGFVFEALFWGFPMGFGVFQDYYSKLPDFEADTAQIPLIGTIATAFVYLGSPLSALATKRFPGYRRQQIWLGWPLCIGGLLAASFTKSVGGLIATQGFMYGLGFVTLTYPIISMINEWWVSRKGMAFGLISAASGASGAAMPFILTSLLEKYGYQRTLQSCAVAMVIFTAPLIPLLKGRLPPSEQSNLARTNWSFLKRPLFYIYGLAVMAQGLGFFFPITFLPSYASSIGISSLGGALLLALMSIAQVFGQFALGYLSDKSLSVGLLAVVCCVSGALATFIFWGLARSFAMLVLFSIVYGFFAFGFGTMRVGMGREVSGDPLATFAVFVFLQGIGNILVGPISAALMSTKSASRHNYADGTYMGIVLVTGTSSVLAASIIVIGYIYRHFLR